MLTGTISSLDIWISAAIIIAFTGLAFVFYFLIRKLLHNLSKKTNTQFDDLLLKAVEWPLFALIVLLGMYVSFVYLPFHTDFDFEIRRVFHLVYIIVGAVTISLGLDAVFRWFKLEVASKTNTPIDDWIVAFVRIISPVIIVIIAVLSLLELYNVQADAFKSWLTTYGTRLGLIIVITIIALLVVGAIVSKSIQLMVARRPAGQPEEEVQKRANTLSAVILTSFQVFIIVIAVFIILSEFIDITPALASVGVIGIALGMGAQSLVKDMIGGFFIVMENQFRVGDVVNIAGIGGLVEDINLRRTILRDLDGTIHTIPNGQITVASNLTKEFSRVNLNISVAYGTDLDHAIEVANRVCRQLAQEPEWAPLIIKTPTVLRVDNLGQYGIDLKITGDTKPVQQWTVMGELRKRLVKAFDEEGIEIPWPTYKVHFGNAGAIQKNPNPN
jgi:moderate conductance mechanosensitive channel